MVCTSFKICRVCIAALLGSLKHICDRVEVYSVMGKVVSKIEDKVAVENIEDNNLLDCKQAGRMRYGVIGILQG